MIIKNKFLLKTQRIFQTIVDTYSVIQYCRVDSKLKSVAMEMLYVLGICRRQHSNHSLTNGKFIYTYRCDFSPDFPKCTCRLSHMCIAQAIRHFIVLCTNIQHFLQTCWITQKEKWIERRLDIQSHSKRKSTFGEVLLKVSGTKTLT